MTDPHVQEIEHVIADGFGTDPVDVPLPPVGRIIEAGEAGILEKIQQLGQIQGVTLGAGMQEFGEYGEIVVWADA